MLDIDNFKSVNDRYGHYEGDNVLKRMGDIMKRYIRQVDSAYRYGGEEFTLICRKRKVKRRSRLLTHPPGF